MGPLRPECSHIQLFCGIPQTTSSRSSKIEKIRDSAGTIEYSVLGPVFIIKLYYKLFLHKLSMSAFAPEREVSPTTSQTRSTRTQRVRRGVVGRRRLLARASRRQAPSGHVLLVSTVPSILYEFRREIWESFLRFGIKSQSRTTPSVSWCTRLRSATPCVRPRGTAAHRSVRGSRTPWNDDSPTPPTPFRDGVFLTLGAPTPAS